jgi:hypothetical protein
VVVTSLPLLQPSLSLLFPPQPPSSSQATPPTYSRCNWYRRCRLLLWQTIQLSPIGLADSRVSYISRLWTYQLSRFNSGFIINCWRCVSPFRMSYVAWKVIVIDRISPSVWMLNIVVARKKIMEASGSVPVFLTTTKRWCLNATHFLRWKNQRNSWLVSPYFFLKIDLAWGLMQFDLAEDCRHLIAFLTPGLRSSRGDSCPLD